MRLKTYEELTKRSRFWLGFLFGVYIVVVLRITVFRSTLDLSKPLMSGTVVLTLFRGYLELLRDRQWFSFVYLFGGNICWFVPYGMYLQYTGRTKRLWQTALLGLSFSLFIEVGQYVFGTGFSELDDLVLNTLGVWLGAAVVKITFRLLSEKNFSPKNKI